MKLVPEGSAMTAFFNGNSKKFENSKSGFHQAVKWLEGLL